MVKKGAYRKSRDKCVADDEWGRSKYNSESSSILPAPDPTNGDLIDEVKYHNKIMRNFPKCPWIRGKSPEMPLDQYPTRAFSFSKLFEVLDFFVYMQQKKVK